MRFRGEARMSGIPALTATCAHKWAGRIVNGQLKQPRTELSESEPELSGRSNCSRGNRRVSGCLRAAGHHAANPSRSNGQIYSRGPDSMYLARCDWAARDGRTMGRRVHDQSEIVRWRGARDWMGAVARTDGRREWMEQPIQHWVELRKCRRTRPSTGPEPRNGR